jgi:hypothetical protein
MNVGAPHIYLRWKADIVDSGWAEHAQRRTSRMNVERLIFLR